MQGGLRSGLLCLCVLAPPRAWAFLADAGVRTEPAAPFAIGLPEKPWQLQVELPGVEMGPVQRLPGGARAFGTVERSGWEVSLTLATSPGDPSARSCRDHDWAGRQQATLQREHIQLSTQGEQARVEFLVPSVDGVASNAKHVLLYLERDGVCAVVHLTKLRYLPADAQTFAGVLASVRLGG
jgi:hypothetical protein